MQVVTLKVNGRKMRFSKQNLEAIVEEQFSFQTNEVAPTPMQGKWFEVNPRSINTTLFLIRRRDAQQEFTRRLILEAFAEVDKNPKKYFKKFRTMIPSKAWNSKTVTEFKTYARSRGCHVADWVEYALELAQRINNGETWKKVCNLADTAMWYRVVIWKNGCARLVGGSMDDCFCVHSPSEVQLREFEDSEEISNVVPLLACNG